MKPAEVESALESMTLLVDTREHPGHKLEKRVKISGLPYRRQKLDFGDYSAEITVDGVIVPFDHVVAIERKMDANELAMCFGQERQRFEKEFVRAQKKGARLYLIVEDENIEKIYAGRYGSSEKYRSKFPPKALMGSILAWAARYGVHIMFCKGETSGKLIRDILYYEIRERLLGEDESV